MDLKVQMKDIAEKMGFESIKPDDLTLKQQQEALETLIHHFRAYDIGTRSKKKMISGPNLKGRRVTTWGLVLNVIRWNRDAPQDSPAGLIQGILDQMSQHNHSKGISYTPQHPLTTDHLEPQMVWEKQVLIAPKPVRLSSSFNIHIDRLTCERKDSSSYPTIEMYIRFRTRPQDIRFQRTPKWV